MFLPHKINLILELAKVLGLSALGSEVLSSMLGLLSLKSDINFNFLVFSWVSKKKGWRHKLRSYEHDLLLTNALVCLSRKVLQSQFF